MASFRIRVLHSIVLGLVVISFVIYSSFNNTPLQVHYIDKQEYGQNSSRTPVLQPSEIATSINSDKIASSTQPEDSPTGLSVASLVAYPLISSPSLGQPYISVATVTDFLSNSSNRPKKDGVDEAISPARESDSPWEKKEAKKQESVSLPAPPSTVHSRSRATVLEDSSSEPMARGVITSCLYAAGHDIEAAGLCPDAGAGMQVLVLVTSAPRHGEARMAIRQTWGHFGVRRDVGVGFFVASSTDDETQRMLESESFLYGDVIRANFLDSYVNLTLKTISMLEWVDKHCPKVRFVLKTDDDMFINVARLLSFVGKHSGEKRTIYGRLAKKWKPIRNKKSKYYVSSKQYKPAVFPDFTTGPAYLITSDSVHDLYTTALNKTYLHLEDVFATGIVAQDIKIRRVHANEFINKRISFHACNIQKGISIHMVKYPEQFDLWKKLLDGRTKCK